VSPTFFLHEKQRFLFFNFPGEPSSKGLSETDVDGEASDSSTEESTAVGVRHNDEGSVTLILEGVPRHFSVVLVGVGMSTGADVACCARAVLACIVGTVGGVDMALVC